ncbi:MAG: flagellar M-ring protein FliF [Candidatus Cloacimonetes bacterium]|nr:flagellar M-ring protein FliF [Candidatus Cloacimonadota bacterium]
MKHYFFDFKNKAGDIYQRLEARQKIVLGALLLMTIVAFAFLVHVSTRTHYELLFGNMEPQQANQAIEKLDEMKVPYRLRNGGTAILVPQDRVYETRIRLSGEGVIPQAGRGFEVFDKPNLGMTEKITDIKYQQALAGELERTIASIDRVDDVRIQLVLPKERLFAEDQKDATASVFLRLSSRLKEAQVQGIANLVAAAVEGLDAADVTITDQNGNTLSEVHDENFAGTWDRLRYQRAVEEDRRQKIQSMLDNLLEPGNAVVRVTADLDFDKIETTMETFNPEGKTPRSEEIESTQSSETYTPSGDIENVAMADENITTQTEHIITNYEIDHTLRSISNTPGAIRKLSVAVNVNHRLDIVEVDGETVERYEERSAAELANIESLVRNAAGYSTDRGDELVVTSFKLEDDRRREEARRRMEEERSERFWEMAIRLGILVVLLILVFSLLAQFRRVFAPPETEEELATVRQTLADGEPDTEGFYPEGEEGLPMGEGKISYSFKPMQDIKIEQTDSQVLQDAVRQFVVDNPETAVRLFKSWMLDKGQR